MLLSTEEPITRALRLALRFDIIPLMLDKEQLYQQRLKRYVTAMRHGKPDRIPIRPFAAELVARYAGFTCHVDGVVDAVLRRARYCVPFFTMASDLPGEVGMTTFFVSP